MTMQCQTIGCNGFTTTCFVSHESSSGYVQNLLVWAVLLLTVLGVVGQCEVVAGLTLIWTKFWKHISSIVTRIKCNVVFVSPSDTIECPTYTTVTIKCNVVFVSPSDTIECPTYTTVAILRPLSRKSENIYKKETYFINAFISSV
jgi:hypothetical protein